MFFLGRREYRTSIGRDFEPKHSHSITKYIDALRSGKLGEPEKARVNWTHATQIFTFLNHAIAIRVTFPAPLKFCGYLKYATVYARYHPGPSVRRTGGHHICVWTILPSRERIRSRRLFRNQLQYMQW
jgi:hypothetical protein